MNRRVKSSILGAIVAAKSPAVRLAAVGSTGLLVQMLEKHYGRQRGNGGSAIGEDEDEGKLEKKGSEEEAGVEAVAGEEEEAEIREESGGVERSSLRFALVTALCAATACGLDEVCDLFLSFDDQCQDERGDLRLIAAKDNDGMTPLMHSARAGQASTLANIIDR